MKSIKLIRAAALFLCMVFMLAMSVIPTWASEPLEVSIDRYVAEDGVLKVYINHNLKKGFDKNEIKVESKFGTNDLQTMDTLLLSDEKVPISYLCVVDVSGSMSQQRIDLAKDVIKQIAKSKKKKDSISIVAMEDTLNQTKYMTSYDKIAAEADKLVLTNHDTNLYSAIVEKIKSLQTANEVNRKRCLIIFSDGADDQATGVTKEEATQAVKKSHIPVFTVGLLADANDDTSKNMAKVLGSFARMSAGGVHYVPALSPNLTAKKIAKQIMGRLNNSLIFYLDITNADVSGKEVVLKETVSYTATSETAEDSIKVPESDIKLISAEKDKSESSETTKEPEEKKEQEKTPEKKILGIPAKIFRILVIAAIVLVILAIALIVWKNGKLDDDAVNQDAYYAGTDQQNASYVQNGQQNAYYSGVDVSQMPYDAGNTQAVMDNSGVTQAIMSNGGAGVTMPVTGRMSEKSLHVTLTRLGKDEEKKYEIDLKGQCTLGRSASQAKMAFPDDKALSGLHCVLLYQNDKVYVADQNSKNGTFVNGVPVSGNFQLSRDDVILIGSYEYRIYWK